MIRTSTEVYTTAVYTSIENRIEDGLILDCLLCVMCYDVQSMYDTAVYMYTE